MFVILACRVLKIFLLISFPDNNLLSTQIFLMSDYSLGLTWRYNIGMKTRLLWNTLLDFTSLWMFSVRVSHVAMACLALSLASQVLEVKACITTPGFGSFLIRHIVFVLGCFPAFQGLLHAQYNKVKMQLLQLLQTLTERVKIFTLLQN